MSRHLRVVVLASSALVMGPLGGAEAAEYLCRKLDSSLRIAIEVKKSGHTLPCEVVAEDDRGELAVLYRAEFDRDYCPSRIEKTRDELEGEGWTCEKTSDQPIAKSATAPDEGASSASEVTAAAPGGGNVQIASDGRVVTASRECSKDGENRHLQIEVDDPDSGKPCELIYWATGDRSRPGQVLWRAEHDETFCPRRMGAILGKWTADGWACGAEDVETAASESTTEAVPSPDARAEEAPAGDAPAAEADAAGADAEGSTLEAIVAADAERIGEWMEVEPEIEIVARGDLNDDGTDDAVVFLTYQSGDAGYRQYLMSYLVADGGYELASVKLLAPVRSLPDQARVEQIDKGIIWLTLPGEDDSSVSQTGFRLRDQQLIEVGPDATSAND